VVALLLSLATHAESPPQAKVLHWWTSGGEAAAVRSLADAYAAAGGVWRDIPIAGSEQARAIAVSRITGGDPPTAALFNASRQFRELAEAGLLNDIDAVAQRDGWERYLPESILSAIRVNGHYYAAPVSIHSPTWIWYSKAAFRHAGIVGEPHSFEELFAALERLKASGLIPLALGGQPWQENILFRAVLANEGGRALYLRVLRDRDPAALRSMELRRVLLTFKRLRSYVDPAASGRNWNDATALLISGRAGVQIMGDWVKAEFANAHLQPGRDYGCLPGLGPRAPYIVQGDAFVFPKSPDPGAARAQRLLAQTVAMPAVQVTFSQLKGSIPVRPDVDGSRLDECARLGLEALADRERQVGNDETYLSPGQNGAISDVLTNYWNRELPVEGVQQHLIDALQD
jgi:glucose/mannose transport system substrate-binding protein